MIKSFTVIVCYLVLFIAYLILIFYNLIINRPLTRLCSTVLPLEILYVVLCPRIDVQYLLSVNFKEVIVRSY